MQVLLFVLKHVYDASNAKISPDLLVRTTMQITNPGDNLTIGDLVQRYLDKQGNKAKKGYKGSPLIVEQAPYSQVMKNIVDSLYQRMLSHAKIKSYGQCNFGLMVASIISRRPVELEEYAGDYVIDGQHKEVIYGVNCDENAPPVTQQVLVHEYDPTISKIANLKRILMAEAELFWSLNTLRRKLTKVDELRAEVVCGEEDATACSICHAGTECSERWFRLTKIVLSKV